MFCNSTLITLRILKVFTQWRIEDQFYGTPILPIGWAKHDPLTVLEIWLLLAR